MKLAQLTALVFALSLHATAADAFYLDPAQAGINEPAEWSDEAMSLESDRQLLDRSIRDAKLGDDMFIITLSKVPQYLIVLDEFVMRDDINPIINCYALNEWLSNTIGIAKEPKDLECIPTYLNKVAQQQAKLKTYATMLLKGPYAMSSEELYQKTAAKRKQFLQMFQ